MTDKFKDGESMLPAATDKKSIKIKQPAGKTQVIINPPEKVDPQRGFQERFKTALQKHTVMMEKRTELVLQAKAARTHFPEESVKQVYIRGFKSLPLNSELTREQYAMNRVNSFIAGGAALVEDCDLLPIYERVGMKGTGGAMRPHIKREKSVYNGKTLYHVMDAKGNKKHSTTDEFAAKKHLAQKYHAYMKEEVEQVNELKSSTLMSYLNKVHDDSQKHRADPTKRKPEKASKSVMGFSRAFNKLETRKEEVVAEGYNDLGPEYGGAYVNGRSDDARMTAKLTRQAKAAAAKAGKTFSTSAEYRLWHKKQKPKKQGVAEEVELDEVSTDGYYKAAVKSRMNAAVKVASSMGKDKQAVTKLNARNAGMKRAENRTRDEMKKANSGPQRQSTGKEPTEAERRGYGQGRYMGDSVEHNDEAIVEAQSAAIRWQKALANAKKKREEEEARREANEKRALTPQKDKQ